MAVTPSFSRRSQSFRRGSPPCLFFRCHVLRLHALGVVSGGLLLGFEGIKLILHRLLLRRLLCLEGFRLSLLLSYKIVALRFLTGVEFFPFGLLLGFEGFELTLH